MVGHPPTVKKNSNNLTTLLLRLADKDEKLFGRIGLASSVKTGEHKIRLAELDEETKRGLPCLRYENGLHTIRIIQPVVQHSRFASLDLPHHARPFRVQRIANPPLTFPSFESAWQRNRTAPQRASQSSHAQQVKLLRSVSEDDVARSFVGSGVQSTHFLVNKRFRTFICSTKQTSHIPKYSFTT
jgi:hypothetical protein